MPFKFSDDYKGPGFGFLTKANEYDKWVHFAGSAAGMLLMLGIIQCLIALLGPSIFTLWLRVNALLIATWIVGGVGLGIEIWQGWQAGIIRAKLESEEGTNGYIPWTVLFGDSNGFSWLDLIADIAGIALVWGLWI